MQFSIIIPTFQNFKYLKNTLDSIDTNSSYKHEIVIHINGEDIETEFYLKNKYIKYTKTKENVGLCSGVNMAADISTKDYILYSHDDMFFLPNWDNFLIDEINKIKHNKFYLSMTQISYTKGIKGNLQHIHYDCGDRLDNFNKKKLLENFHKLYFRDLQGSHWAPHLIHKSLWNKIGGFSEEYNPGFASDPDLNMKLWREGVRIFKGVSKSRLYHFGSITTRKNRKISKNNGKKTFLLKWKISVEFFVKHYLKRGGEYDGPLNEPIKNINYYYDFSISTIKYFLIKLFR